METPATTESFWLSGSAGSPRPEQDCQGATSEKHIYGGAALPCAAVLPLFVVLAIGIVFAIAAVVIGREARRLASQTPQRTFDFEEAVTWVCDNVSIEVASVLSPEDVRQILNWHLEYFRVKGVSSNGSGPHNDGPVVVSGAETVDFVLGRAASVGADFTPEQVHAVLDAQMGYLTEIGAVGPVADGEEP